MRFYSGTHGSIEIDGENIENFTLESYRQRFASVFQDTTLFNESIRHNLEYVRDGITENDLKKNLNIIIGELSQPPYEDVIESVEENVFPKKLPDLRSPIIAAWLLDSNKKLILDLDENSIYKELSSIKVKLEVNEDSIFDKQNREEEALEKKREEEVRLARVKVLNTALLALEKTIFENFPSIETLEFKLNGHSKELSGLEYKLNEIRKRN